MEVMFASARLEERVLTFCLVVYIALLNCLYSNYVNSLNVDLSVAATTGILYIYYNECPHLYSFFL